jgi:hypothetical protein
MLTELCQELHNWFEREKRSGSFRIADGMLEADFLLPGQYFRVMGSIFNDGVHQYGNDFLNDEDFTGSVWSLAIPEAVIKLSEDIDAWRAKYEAPGSTAMSPYMSESFGGYSYSKGSAISGTGTGGATSWRTSFASRMNAWRKL